MPDKKYPEPDADWFREQAIQELSEHFHAIGKHERCPPKWAEKRQQVHDYLAAEAAPGHRGLALRPGWRRLRLWMHAEPADFPRRLCELYGTIHTAIVALDYEQKEEARLSEARRQMV